MSELHVVSPAVLDRSYFRARTLCALIAACAALSSAFAAPPPRSDQLQIEEVVVTATRVGSVDLQITPMAITAVSPEQLDSKGLTSFSDIAMTLPAVNLQSLSPGENQVDMRGLVTNAVDPTNAQTRPTVAIYLDDTAITQQGFTPDLHVYDLERIEVVRGPQGTLYGAGSMGGTIRFITKQPDTNLFSASADASVSETHHGGTNYSVRGVLNLPIVDNRLGARITAYRSDDSGYIDNVELQQARANPAYSTQARLVVRWLPVDALTVDTSFTYAKQNVKGRNAVFPQLGDYTYSSLTPEPFTDDFQLGNITVTYDFGSAKLISSTAYVKRDFIEQESFEAINQALLTPCCRLASPNANINDVHEFQQEIRLVSRPDQKLRWIAGAYFERESRFYTQNVPVVNFDAVFGAEIGDPTFNSMQFGTPAPDTIFWGTIGIEEKQFALFGEATYEIAPKLDLTLGLRYFHFKDNFDLYFTGVAGAIGPGVPNTTTGQQDSSGTNPRGVLSYKVNDHLMVYGEAARGFRYGGVNEPAPIVFCAAQLAALGLTQSPATFGPDYLWSYTVGEKGKFADGRLLFNVDGFYIDWHDVQTIHDISCGYYFAENKGEVTSKGIELEAKFRVTSGLTLGLSGSYTDATANGAISNLGAADGDRVPFFPREIMTVAADYGIPLPEGRIALSADYTYRSNSYTQFSQQNSLIREIPSSEMLNASINYIAARWSVGVYGTNLTNNHLISMVAPNNYGIYQPGDTQYWGRPQTIGVHFHIGW